MDVKLFANLAESAGTRIVPVEPGHAGTVGEAIDAVCASHPDLREEVFDGDGRPHDHINILLNGTNVVHADGLEEAVDPADEIAIFPPVSGG